MKTATKNEIVVFAVVDLSAGWVRSWHETVEAARKGYAKQPFGVCIVETEISNFRSYAEDRKWVPTYENTRHVEYASSSSAQ